MKFCLTLIFSDTYQLQILVAIDGVFRINYMQKGYFFKLLIFISIAVNFTFFDSLFIL